MRSTASAAASAAAKSVLRWPGPGAAAFLLATRLARTAMDAVIVSWAVDMRRLGCECSAGRMRDFVQWGLIAHIAIGLALLPFWHSVPAMVATTVLSLVVYGAVYMYARGLPGGGECACADGGRRRLAEVWPAASLAVTMLSAVAFVYAKGKVRDMAAASA